MLEGNNNTSENREPICLLKANETTLVRLKGDYPVTFDEIKELIAVLSTSDIAEVTVETNGVKLSVKKGSAFLPAPQTAIAPVPVAPAPERGSSVPATEAAPSDSDDADGRITITAPMVGTFYRAPSPDSDPYVKSGDRVETGQPLCIIEAMKLMNEIESEVQGRVVEILVENGQPVEYGQPLFIIELA